MLKTQTSIATMSSNESRMEAKLESAEIKCIQQGKAIIDLIKQHRDEVMSDELKQILGKAEANKLNHKFTTIMCSTS